MCIKGGDTVHSILRWIVNCKRVARGGINRFNSRRRVGATLVVVNDLIMLIPGQHYGACR
jgi:hypothetical protein